MDTVLQWVRGADAVDMDDDLLAFIVLNPSCEWDTDLPPGPRHRIQVLARNFHATWQ